MIKINKNKNNGDNVHIQWNPFRVKPLYTEPIFYANQVSLFYTVKFENIEVLVCNNLNDYKKKYENKWKYKNHNLQQAKTMIITCIRVLLLLYIYMHVTCKWEQ